MSKYNEHALFKLPEDREATVFRYMDLTRFVALLEDRALFFARGDLLGDEHEGSLSELSLKQLQELPRASLIEPVSGALKIAAQKADLDTAIRQIHASTRKGVFVSSWNIQDCEGELMWKKYVRDRPGVAIQSSVDRLRRSFVPGRVFDYSTKTFSLRLMEAEVHIGTVNYVNYKRTAIPAANILAPFLYKRREFEAERELRAIVVDPNLDELTMSPHTPAAAEPLLLLQGGILVPVDLSVLIAGVVLAPGSPPWIRRLVVQLHDRHGLSPDVRASSLDLPPFA